MKLLKNKKITSVFIFIFLLISLSHSDFNRTISYFNTEYVTSKPIEIEVEFSNNSIELKNSTLRLYYAYNNANEYDDNKTKLSIISKNTAKFKLDLDSIPNLYRIDFDKQVEYPLAIKRITIFSNGNYYNIDLKRFYSHPSLKFKSKHQDYIILEKSNIKEVGFSPYIYLYHPIHIHSLNLIEYLSITIVLILISFILSNIIYILLQNKITDTIINELLLFFLFFTLPLEEHWNSKVLILIGVFVIYSLVSKQKKSAIKLKTYFLYFFISTLSLIWSIDVSNSIVLLGRMVPFILLPLWIMYLPKNINFKKVFSAISLSYVLIGIYALTIAAIRFFSSNNISEFYYHTLVSPFTANAIYIALLFLGVFIFELYFLFMKFNLIGFIKLIFIFFFIILLSSKMMTFLAILAIVFVSIYFISKKFDNKILISISAIASILILTMLFSSSDILRNRFKKISNISQVKEVLQKDSFGRTYPWNGLTLRILQLKSFIDIEKDKNFNSLLGVGLNNGQKPLIERYKKYNLYQGKSWEKNGGFLHYNFHNQYAQTLIELGIVGFLFLLLIFIKGFNTSYNDKNILLLVFMLIFVFILITESLLVRQKGIVAFVFFPLVSSLIVFDTKEKDAN